MPYPLLYEINTRCWLQDLSRTHRRDIDLFAVPDDELDGFVERGFTHVWLMGVWPTGPQSRGQALHHPQLQRAYREALPDWHDSDVIGSPYAIGANHVWDRLGGDEGLEHLRARMHEHDLALLLDFVPNHTGLDHTWALTRPDVYVQSASPFPDSWHVKTKAGSRFLAHGKDPHFPAWTDTLQLDYRRRQTRDAVLDMLRAIADRCDGVRCDMAMLLLSDVFERTWHHLPPLERADRHSAAQEFWHDAITTVKARAPRFLFLAEAYWGLEARLQELGFDFTYDKKLTDLLVERHAADVAPHLQAQPHSFLAKSAHFLENHDEPRIASRLTTAEQRAAALLVLSLPGMRFLHDGQLQGRRTFVPVQLGRRRDEPDDDEVRALYDRLLSALQGSLVGRGVDALLPTHAAWPGNDSHRGMVIVQWHADEDVNDGDNGDAFDLVVVNLSAHRAQCRVPLTAPRVGEGSWLLVDRLSDEKWERSGDELAGTGLYLDVAAHGAQLFHVRRA